MVYPIISKTRWNENRNSCFETFCCASRCDFVNKLCIYVRTRSRDISPDFIKKSQEKLVTLSGYMVMFLQTKYNSFKQIKSNSNENSIVGIFRYRTDEYHNNNDTTLNIIKICIKRHNYGNKKINKML